MRLEPEVGESEKERERASERDLGPARGTALAAPAGACGEDEGASSLSDPLWASSDPDPAWFGGGGGKGGRRGGAAPDSLMWSSVRSAGGWMVPGGREGGDGALRSGASLSS